MTDRSMDSAPDFIIRKDITTLFIKTEEKLFLRTEKNLVIMTKRRSRELKNTSVM